MSTSPGDLPKPQRRLLRTLLKLPRKLHRFAPRISYEEAARELPDLAEAGHWGQVVLLNDAVVVLHRDGTTSRSVHYISMLHGDQDLAEWDEVTRNYDRSISTETIRKAIVHLPDGTRRKAVRTVTPLDTYNRMLNVQFSPLRPGVVVEFEEQFDRFTADPVGPCVWDQMFLQSWAPCRRMRFTVAVARPFHADFNLSHCDDEPTESDERGYHVFRWNLENVPGIETDQWTPNPRDFAPWVDITTLNSWQPVARHYIEELEPPAKTPEPVKKLTRELVAEATSDRDKVLAIYQYATRDVRYGRHPRELMLESPREAGKMLEDLRGDCKDKSALIVSMLQELQIPAKIALVLTRMNGETPFLPGARFDHAVVRTQLNGEELWIDAAGGPYTFGDIPFNDQGIRALILDGDDSTMTEIPPATVEQHRVERSCQGKIEADGTYQYEAETTASGEQAAALRIQYLDRSEEHRLRTMAQTVAADLTGAEVTEVKFIQLEDLTEKVAYEYSITLKQWGRRVEDILLFRIPWADPIETSGPVSAGHRIGPLAGPGVYGNSERHEIEIPAGYSGYGLPFHAEENCEWGRYRCTISEKDGILTCERTVDYLGGIVSPERFEEFKRYWEASARSDAADVVLMKHDAGT